MSDTPTPPRGIWVDDERTDGVERLQTRLLHIGLLLVTVVVLGGGGGVLVVAAEPSSATVASVAVVCGCVVAVLVALAAAMSATRRVAPLLRSPRQVHAPAPAPDVAQPAAARPLPQPRADVPPTPLWSQPGGQITLTDDPGQRREVFVKLARRLQSLINRAIKRIDELEQENEDPELLDGLYEIDHLFTLARRQGENLAVLGGEAPQRRSDKPVSVYAVLLAAVSEAEHYRQISIVPVEEVEIHGHAVAEIIHLLAELLENATRFTSPDGPKVEVRAHRVTAGLAIEVQDRGLGMSYEDLERINRLLDGSTRIDLSELLEDGRIGLAVVRELARRHDIRVRLQSNIFGGIAAAVVVPPRLLSEPQREARTQRPPVVDSALPKRHVEQDATGEQPVPLPSAPAHTGPDTAQTTGPSPTGRLSTPQPAPQARVQPALPNRTSGDLSHAPSPMSVPTTWEPPAPQAVPTPVPLPSTSQPGSATGSSPGPGSAGSAQPTGRRHRQEPQDEHEPPLPVRAPGLSYEDLRAGGSGSAAPADAPAAAQWGDRPPPLPQRTGSHLHPELVEPPQPTRPVPGHNTNLMKTVQAGRDNWLTEQDHEANTSRGDSASWPTT